MFPFPSASAAWTTAMRWSKRGRSEVDNCRNILNFGKMVVRIKKGQSKKEIEATLKRLKSADKPVLADFFGKMKGKFGDALEYQKSVRDEWN
jgi:hypothetical protein